MSDTIIIGGGIIGVATAFWLSRAGLDVVLVEMRDGLSTLTTPASVECFRAQFTEPAMAALAIPSIEMFEHFDEVIGLPGYSISIKQQGYLFLTDNPQTVDDLKENVDQQLPPCRQTAVKYVESDMLVIAFGQGGPQVNRPNKGIDGQFEQLRDGAVQNVTGKYLNGHRRQHQNVNPAGQVNFEKIEYLFQYMFHDAVIRRNQRAALGDLPI